MKRTLSIIAALLAIMSIMTFAVGAAVGEVESDYTPAEGSVGISSLSEITDPAGVYHLTGDITVDATYAEAFSGVLDGCGHTVTVSAPMFAELNGTVKNMTLNGSIEATDTSAAAVALKSTGGMTAMNITSNVDITVSGTASDLYAAAIVCKSTSTDVANTFMAIVNNGDITVNAPEGSKPRAAGIAALINYAAFTDCMNNGTVSMNGYQSVTGGICARASLNGGDIDFNHCVNNGDVTGTGHNAYAGGICGYAGKSGSSATYDFIGCVNTGDITASYECAGIVAYVYANADQYPVIENCINTGAITFGGNDASSTPNVVWGSPFVGYANSVNTSIKNNIDTGSLTCVIEGFANYTFIGISSANLATNYFANNYVTDLATKFNYLAYASSDKNSANRIAIDQAGAALTDATVDYICSDEFISTTTGFIKTDSLPVVSSGDSWNGGEYVMAVAEHVCGGLTKVEAVAATCGDKGNIEYYTCSCGRYYKDAEANEEITDKGSVIIPIDTSISHTWGETVYTWTYHPTTGFPNRCVASRACSVCGGTEKATGTLSGKLTAAVATCVSEGKQYRTATFSVDWATESTSDPEKYIIAIDSDNHAKTATNVKNNGDGTHSAVYECCNKTVEAEAHILVQGETGFEGKYHDATALTLAVSCKTCDYSEVLKSSTFGSRSGWNASCHTPARAIYRNVDFGNGIIIDVMAYDPSGELDPENHEYVDKIVDNGDCSHTLIYGCCENVTEVTKHSYSNGICRNCKASQEERELMHKWEVSYKWLQNNSGYPYRCNAIRACSICNARNTKSTTLKIVEETYANCQRAGSATYTATFDVEWAETQTKSFDFDVNPSNHASGWVWYINSDGTHSQMYPCCGALTNTAAHTYDETTKKCTECGYTEGATLYTVTFIADGKVVCTTNACVGSNVIKVLAPQKEDYTFDYWYTEKDGKGNPFTSPYNTEGDTTYYAYYRNKFTVRFRIAVNNVNYSAEILKDVPYGTTISAPDYEKYASIVPDGYYFDGWYTSNRYTKEFDFENTKITSDMWVYGKLTECTSHTWGEVAYEWSDDYSGCTAVRRCTRCNYADTDVATSVQVSVTEKATCAKTGFATGTVTFAAEWATDMSGEIIIAIDPDNHANPSVTYKWENNDSGIPYKCTATFSCDACGYMETVSANATWILYKSRPTCQAEGIAYKTASFSAEYPWAEEQKSEEYVVAKDPNIHISSVYSIKDDTYHTRKYLCCGAEQDFEHNMSNSVCQNCGYKEGEKQYTVTFMVDGKEYAKTVVCYGSRVNSPNTPSKEGCVFVNWFTKENGEGDRIIYTYNIEGDTTYYAYFTNKVNYRFRIVNLEGKQQTIIPYTEVLYGTTVSAPTFSEYADKIPEGYYIEGWYTGSSFNTEFDFSQPLTKLNTSIYGKLAELKGWCKIDGEWYYYNEDGTKATGFSRVPYNTELGHAPNADDLAYFNANSEASKYTDATTAVYCFSDDGKLLRKTGLVDDKGTVRYAVDGVIAWHVGMVEADGEYYYFGGDVNGGGNVMLTGNVYATRNTTKLDMVKSGVYTFAEDGKMCKYEGLTEIDGVLYYYEDYCRSKGTGVVKTAEGYIYVRTTNLEVVTDKQYWVSKTAESGVIKGIYVIDANGFIKDPVLVNAEATTGIFDGYYYVDGEVQYAAGAIEIDGDIYYVRANGQIVAGGEYWVTQSSELLPAGKYTFDNDGKLVK